mgnify:CR=1 FL=1
MAKYNNYTVKKLILFSFLEYTYRCNEEIPYKKPIQVSSETAYCIRGEISKVNP